MRINSRLRFFCDLAPALDLRFHRTVKDVPQFITAFLFLTAVVTAQEIDTQGGQIELEMISEVRSIEPGQTFTVGLRIWHEKEWHTYWKQPGIVGVPTSLKWELPEGFRAGEIQWPAPERTKMASLTAWGYEREVILLVDITAPRSLKPGETVRLTAKGTWMTCAQTCHPGWGDFALELPVRDSDAAETPDWDPKWHPRVAQTRSEFPRPLKGWEASVKPAAKPNQFVLALHNRGGDPFPESADLYFFCYDEQVHSDMKQIVTRQTDGSVELLLVRPDFAPKDPKELRGVIYNSAGWDAKPGGQFAEVAAAW